MKLLWSTAAWEDYLYWQENDRQILQRINALLQDIRRHPFNGIGKPEPLRGDLAGVALLPLRDAGNHVVVQVLHDAQDPDPGLAVRHHNQNLSS